MCRECSYLANLLQALSRPLEGKSIYLVRSVHTIQCLEPIITQIEKISDANQHFYELEQ